MKRITKFSIGLIIGFSLLFSSAYAATILRGFQGGTGIGTATSGDVGKFLKLSDDSPMTYVLDTVVSSGGTVTGFSFTNANGFIGTVVDATSTPSLTLSTSLSTGSIPFIDASGALTQDNTNFFWDDTNNRLGIGTASPGARLDIVGSGSTGSTSSLIIKNSSGYNLVKLNDNGDTWLGNNEFSIGHRILIDGTTSDSGFYVTSYNSSLFGGTLTLYGASNIIGYSQSLGDFLFRNENSSTDLMYLSSTGSLGIGTTSPTALLHIAAGTATANTSPLKFTSGVNLTTPESGAIEYDGTELYFTPTSNRYKLAQVVEGSSTYGNSTYTPTITGITNVSSATAYVTGYYRNGNTVTVFGQVEITATANNTQTTFRMSLPIASNFANTYEAGGGGYTQNNATAGHGINISADTTNKELLFDYYETHGTSDVFNFTASYQIIP